MKLEGRSIIAGKLSSGAAQTGTWQATNPATGESLAPVYHAVSADELDSAVESATAAFDAYSSTGGNQRAAFLSAIAEKIEAQADDIVARMNAESALPEARCRGELARTTGQLRMFAELLKEGSWCDARIDTAQPNREPLPKPDLRSMLRPRGPAAVFCASNFPLAYSVAGGDTASAFAAGCPVIVRAHSAHPGTAEIVGKAVSDAVKASDLPEGTFSLVYDDGIDLGTAIAKHPGISAIGFTGSRSGGRALMDLAAARKEPIPVFAEMSSVNPVFVLPGALSDNGEEIATNLAASVNLGLGQFCTSPGLVFVLRENADSFSTLLKAEFTKQVPAPMLHQGIADNYKRGVDKLKSLPDAELLAEIPTDRAIDAGPAVFRADGANFIKNPRLSEEVFGPATILIECADHAEMLAAAESLEGQLTATLHTTEDELASAGDLVSILQRKAGRIIFNGFPTGVEVCHSMVHGGPYPATSDGGSTAVGPAAIRRFTRPVCWQEAPESSLPEELQSANPLGISRLLNGTRSAAATQ